jgi:hypothetical protein
MENQKIQIAMILETLGKPQEYLKEFLNEISEKISKEKNVKILNKKIAEPKKVPDKEDIFSSFLEIELEVEDLRTLLFLMFQYMPAHIEIISPENLNLKKYDLDVSFNELSRRLHQYDELARIALNERQILINQLKALNANAGNQEQIPEQNTQNQEMKKTVKKTTKKKPVKKKKVSKKKK